MVGCGVAREHGACWRGREQVAAVQAPENRPGQPRKDARREKQGAWA